MPGALYVGDLADLLKTHFIPSQRRRVTSYPTWCALLTRARNWAAVKECSVRPQKDVLSSGKDILRKAILSNISGLDSFLFFLFLLEDQAGWS